LLGKKVKHINPTAFTFLNFVILKGNHLLIVKLEVSWYCSKEKTRNWCLPMSISDAATVPNGNEISY